MRKDNYLIAMINKGVLAPYLPLPRFVWGVVGRRLRWGNGGAGTIPAAAKVCVGVCGGKAAGKGEGGPVAPYLPLSRCARGLGGMEGGGGRGALEGWRGGGAIAYAIPAAAQVCGLCGEGKVAGKGEGAGKVGRHWHHTSRCPGVWGLWGGDVGGGCKGWNAR